MPSHLEDDWSDSDDERLSDVETSVLLGVPDGLIQTIDDINDAAVSRIGGHPAFLPSREPPFSSSFCKVCSDPCELLVQMWCPFEDSPMDRAMYIWGCAKAVCQGKDGSIRAWRGLRFNEKYAAKLQKKKQLAEQATASAKAHSERRKQAEKVNPFSVGTGTDWPATCSLSDMKQMKITSASNPNPFGVGNQTFGEISSPPHKSNVTQVDLDADNDDPSDTESDSASSERSLLIAMASTTVSDSEWKSAPSYPPLYLSTTSEYVPPQPKSRPQGAQATDPTESIEEGSTKSSEPYEDSLEMDHVFERFRKRIGYEGEQCVRYELGGTPLPFSFDNVFNSLFPSPPVPTLPVTKPAFTAVHSPKRTYTPSLVPCPSCQSKRVFECQLMPNLINVLWEHGFGTDRLTDEQRKQLVEKVLKGQEIDGDGSRIMDWGTCMVFSCEKDCCKDADGREAKECWREEVVLIQAAI